MSNVSRIPLPRRADLVFGPVGDDGQQVVKDPSNGSYFNLGREEAFLLAQLDGKQTVEEICAAFGQHFGQPLLEEDLVEFLTLALAQGFLRTEVAAPAAQAGGVGTAEPAVPTRHATGEPPVATANAPATPIPTADNKPAVPPRWRPQNLLFWRKSFFDPDRFFNWLEPKIRFIWTRAFLILSLLGILGAAALLQANWGELVADLPGALRWEVVVVTWLTLLAATFAHEFAHGLTCKHYGGEVHEIGFLLLFLMPCFYCNVSDAWLFRDKSKRLWVSLAGGYCDLCLWAVAVAVWRLTQPQTAVHFASLVVLTVCGGRIFFNFNPFLKLDGYYLLSDWAEIPNLRQRSVDQVMGHLRWLLWGGPQPSGETRIRFLLVYGSLSWLISLTYLVLMFVGLELFVRPYLGMVGTIVVIFLALQLVRGMFRGFTGDEVLNMILRRHVRTVVWLLLLVGVPMVLWIIPMEDRAGGSFQLRPAVRAELRAPVSGFLRAVSFDEGEQVSISALVARLEVPDLSSRITQKEAEVQEARAKLRLLEAGPRPEEIEEQKQRVSRASGWRDLAEADLASSREAHQSELANLDKLLAQHQAEGDYTHYAYQRDAQLFRQDALSRDQLEEKKKAQKVSAAQVEQVLARKQALLATGTRQAEMELARRQKDLADAQAALRLLEAGSRPEEIEAARSHQARAKAEVDYLVGLQGKVEVYSPVAGLVTTPHLKEKAGQFLKEGDLICTVEVPARLEAEILVSEQEVARVRVGQQVELKARALPYRTFQALVTRIAPVARSEAPAEPGKPSPPSHAGLLNSVTICCAVEDPDGETCPGMTGYARIYTGPRPVLTILLGGALRYLRTEFWW